MPFPLLTPSQRLELLTVPSAPVRMVLDTDAANEIDDQFALAYTLLSTERLQCEAIYAAPFQNDSTGPEEGMHKSYDEIVRVLERLSRSPEGFVHRGSTSWLASVGEPVPSAAVDDLIARAIADDPRPLYVVAIGAITNVASALIKAPQISERIVLVWLGGNPQGWYPATEYNVYQDMIASRLIFDSGVALVHIPAMNVAEHLRTSQAELERYVKGRSKIGDYLYQIYSDYYDDHTARSKEIWDIGAVAWLVNPNWVDTMLIQSPILTSDHAWATAPNRHFMREARKMRRDEIFRDLFAKLARADGA